MYECGKLKKVIGNKFLFPVILEQCVVIDFVRLHFGVIEGRALVFYHYLFPNISHLGTSLVLLLKLNL